MAKSHPAWFQYRAVSRPLSLAQHSKSGIFLLVSLAILGLLYLPVGDRLAGLVPPLSASELPAPSRLAAQQEIAVDPNTSKYRAIGEHLSRRYQVSSELTMQVVAKAYDIGQQLKLDPLLILAIIAVESRFNPAAESVMGAKGLMQVIPRFHPEKFGPLGGERVAFEPAANITVGAKILQEYLRRTGDLVDALQLYVGASTDDAENGYSGKVMAERDRLQGVLKQFQNRVGPSGPGPNIQQQRQALVKLPLSAI